ncbi:Nn.00g057220.m01.CDS01 [Neocucurbitaria sp. VM-36]
MARPELEKVVKRSARPSKSDHRVHKPYSGRTTRSQAAKRDEMILKNKMNSPLLRLPGEVRNQIYSYIFNGYEVEPSVKFPELNPRRVKGCHLRCRIYGSEEWKDFNTWDRLLGLTNVCHQLHGETRLLPFRLNTFQVRYEEDFDFWLSLLTEDQRNAITTVSFGAWGYHDIAVLYEGLPSLLHRCAGLETLIRHSALNPVHRRTVQKFAESKGARLIDENEGSVDEEDIVTTTRAIEDRYFKEQLLEEGYSEDELDGFVDEPMGEYY